MNGHKYRKLVNKQVAKHDASKIKEKEEHPLYELSVTYYGNSIDVIKGMLGMPTAQFLLGNSIGGWCNDQNTGGYNFNLSTNQEREEKKAKKKPTWIIKEGDE